MNLFELENKLDLSVVTRGSHSGQMDLSVIAAIDRQKVGHIDYVVFQDDVSIQMIEVDPEFRKGRVAKRMLLFLQEQYPDTQIDWGMLTSDGEKLYQRMQWRRAPNPESQEKFEEADSIREMMADLGPKIKPLLDDSSRFRAASEQERKWIELYFELKDDLEDIEDDIERYDLKPYKLIMTG